MSDSIRRPMAVRHKIHGLQPVIINGVYAPWSVNWVVEAQLESGIFLTCPYRGIGTSEGIRSACIALIGPGTRYEYRRAYKHGQVVRAVVAVHVEGWCNESDDAAAVAALQGHLGEGWVPEVAAEEAS